MTTESKKYNKWIVVLSITIPLVVAILFGVKIDVTIPVFLPPVYASINAFTSVLLVVAFLAIKKNNIKLHEKLMKTAIVFSALFLVLYVAYHMTSSSTKFGGQGVVRTVYFIVLISHIVLSIVVIPFVLITFVRALTNNIELHKKLARFTFPLWLYVTISGVVVYLMISPYY